MTADIVSLDERRTRRESADIVTQCYELGTAVRQLQDDLDADGALLTDVAALQTRLDHLSRLADAAWILSARLPITRPIEPRKTP